MALFKTVPKKTGVKNIKKKLKKFVKKLKKKFEKIAIWPDFL